MSTNTSRTDGPNQKPEWEGIMKEATRILVLGASLALLLALVSTANAAPGKCNPKKEDCSTTATTPTPTTTVVPGPLGVGLSCEDYAALNPGTIQPLTWNAGNEESQFASPEEPLPVTSGDVAPCIDFLSTTAGSFTVTVTSVEPEPKRNSVLATVVKDSHPGDHCGWIGEDDPRSALNLTLANVDKETGTIEGTIFGVPAATLNACGTPFAEAELQGNEVVNSTTAQDGTPDPLAIMFLVTGKQGITANITLHFKPVGSQ